MDITHTCRHCGRGKKVFRISLDLFDDRGILRPEVQRMKKFEFECHYCFKKSFFDFYRFSYPEVILFLRQLDRKQNELLEALDRVINILEDYLNC